MFTLKFTGIKKMERELHRLDRHFDNRSVSAIDREAQQVYSQSQVYVPVDEGDLKLSGQVSEISRTADGVEATVTYGNESVNYAVIVHEGPDSQGRKFLERALNEAESGMAGRIAEHVRLK